MRKEKAYGMGKLIWLLGIILAGHLASAQPARSVKDRDRKKDVLLTTSKGKILLRLSDSTPLHRDNFIWLVRSGFFEGILFHRVIKGFMIQAGDPKTRTGKKPVKGMADSTYTLPAEFRPTLFHHRGALAAARMGDAVNPGKESSGTQFYIVQGRSFTDASLDSVETFRLHGRKLPPSQRQAYKTWGGAPHLDQNYTVFGEVLEGMQCIDEIAAVETSGRQGGDKPIQAIYIQKAKMVRRKV